MSEDQHPSFRLENKTMRSLSTVQIHEILGKAIQPHEQMMGALRRELQRRDKKRKTIQ